VAAISKARVARAFRKGDAATTAPARGRALEELLVYLFCKIPGVRLIRRNAFTADLSGEIDLVFWNDKSVLDFLPNILMFECKNWDGRVDSASVSFFINKAVNRHLPHAFLIAANGVTGDREQLRSAHAHLHNALVLHDCKVVVLDRAELSTLGNTDELINLVIDKISGLYLLGV
jgi:hypothetical protein